MDGSGIARIWLDLLGQAQVGRDDDFFGLGGHSLLASEMVARLPHRIGAGPALRALFANPTLRGFTAALAEGGVDCGVHGDVHGRVDCVESEAERRV